MARIAVFCSCGATISYAITGCFSDDGLEDSTTIVEHGCKKCKTKQQEEIHGERTRED